MSAPFPWQTRQWTSLTTAENTERLGHALLFAGRSGLGKTACAREFANLILCEHRGPEAACGNCRSCVLFTAGNHPDFCMIKPEEDRRSIGVDQIRELAGYFALKPHYRDRKVAMICPAEAMLRAAANALLKILEEPPPGALIVLIAERIATLPATIRSRCCRLSFEAVDLEPARAWLRQQISTEPETEIDALLHQTAGAPLAARALAASPQRHLPAKVTKAMASILAGRATALSAAQEFDGAGVDLLVEAAMRAVHGALLAKHRRHEGGVTAGVADEELRTLADQLDFKRWFDFLDLLLQTRAMVMNHANVRDTDLVEGVWWGWSDITGASRAGAIV